MKAHRIALISGILSALSMSASADVLANWTFETSIPATSGPFAAESGLFAASSFANGLHTGASTYSSPVGNGSAHSFSSNGWTTIGDYYQFSTSTVGFENILITFDQTRSSTGPSSFDLEYSTDGTTFVTLTDNYVVLQNGLAPNASWTTAGPRVAAYQVGPTAGPAALNDQATIYFRLRSEVTVASTGTNRVDNVIIEGTPIPEPSSLALLALGGLVALRRRSA